MPKDKTPRHMVIAMHSLYLQGYNLEEIAKVFEIKGGRQTLNYLFNRESLSTTRDEHLPKLGDENVTKQVSGK